MRRALTGFHDRLSRERGNVLFFALVILVLLAAFASAQVTFTQKNIQQSNYFFSHSEETRILRLTRYTWINRAFLGAVVRPNSHNLASPRHECTG